MVRNFPYSVSGVDISRYEADLAFASAGSSCTGYANRGRDVVFLVSMKANQQLTAFVVSTFDAALYLLSDCGYMFCEVGVDDVLGEGMETLQFTALEDQDVFVVVDHYGPSGPESGTFDLTLVFEP